MYLPIYFYPFLVGSQHSYKASSHHTTKIYAKNIVIFILMDKIYSLSSVLKYFAQK